MKIDKIIELSDKWDAPVLVRHAKLVEECGEFAEAMLAKLGFLPHKTMKEPAMGEAADVIICVIDTVRELYRNLPDEDFKTFLQEQLDLKAKKWENVLINPQSGNQ